MCIFWEEHQDGNSHQRFLCPPSHKPSKLLIWFSNPWHLIHLQSKHGQRSPAGAIFWHSQNSAKIHWFPKFLGTADPYQSCISSEGNNIWTTYCTHCNNQVSSCHDCKSSVLQDLQQQTGEQPKSHLLNSLPRLATPSLRDLKEPVGHGLISHPGASLCHKASDNPFQHSHWYLEPIHHWGQMFLRTKPLGYLRVWTGIKCTLIRRPSSAKQ